MVKILLLVLCNPKEGEKDRDKIEATSPNLVWDNHDHSVSVTDVEN